MPLSAVCEAIDDLSSRGCFATHIFRPHVTENLIAALTGPLFLDTHFLDA
jgi:hypothetical protein